MKKTLTLVLALLLAIFCFTACDSDDDEPSATAISTAAEFASALEKGGEYVLLNDITYDTEAKDMTTKSNLVIDLNGKTLTVNARMDIAVGNVTLKNGNYAFVITDSKKSTYSASNNALQVNDYCTLTLNHVIMTSDIGCVFMVDRTKDAELEIYDSNLTAKGYYCIGTNALSPASSEFEITVKNSKISVAEGAEGGDNTAFLFNVLGDVTIENSTITADRQAMVARGGNYTIKDTKFVVTGKNSKTTEYLEGDWGSGNEAPLAALVVGNRSAKSYLYNTTMNLEDITIIAPEKNSGNKSYYGIYVYQNKVGDTEYAVSLTGAKPTFNGGVAENNQINSETNNASVFATK